MHKTCSPLFLVSLVLALASCSSPAMVSRPAPMAVTPARTATPLPPEPEPATPTRMPAPPVQLSVAVPPASVAPTLAPTALPISAPTVGSPMPLPIAATPTVRASATASPALPALTAMPSVPTLSPVSVPTLAPGSTAHASIRIDGAFARTSPSLTAPRVFPVFEGNLLSAVGRTADGNWVAVVSSSGAIGWLLRNYAVVEAGFAGLPATQSPGAASVSQVSLPAYLSLPASASQRYRAALAAGRDGRVFTVAGACNSEAYAYVRRVATALYDTSGLTALHGVVQRFAPSFSRVSMAARGGYTVSSLFDPTWVEPGLCPLGEGPLACELRQTNASVVVIELGTGDQFGWKDFEPHYRAIVDYAQGVGALPILVTKADDLDHQQGGAPAGFINDVIRRVGAEKQLPLIDLHSATRGLPNFGLLDEGNFDFHLSPAGSDLHLQVTLQMLNALLQ